MSGSLYIMDNPYLRRDDILTVMNEVYYVTEVAPMQNGCTLITCRRLTWRYRLRLWFKKIFRGF